MLPGEKLARAARADRVMTLGEASEELRGRVGGKTAHLARMMSAGLQVPPGIVVPSDSYESFVAANALKERILEVLTEIDFDDDDSLEGGSQHIKELFLRAAVDWQLAKSIITALDRTDPKASWAVRSSAVAEDLPEASFAGQQDSFLCVRREHVPEHVKKCWASYWNARAIKYRHDSGMDQFVGGIAVIIQKMVNATASGVMFTSDPVTGRKDLMVVESSWGLGEAVASGTVTPDRFLCEKKGLSIVQRSVEHKASGVFMRDGRRAEEVIDPEKAGEPSITDAEIRMLAEVGRRVEELLGCPQDVEWSIEDGRMFVLQSRPITTLDTESMTLWTRAYGDEYWSEVTSPLFYSLLGEYLTEYVNREGSRVMGYKELTDKDLLKVHKGHVYFNTAVLESVFTYNPKFSRTKELLNYFPVKDQPRIATARTKVPKRLAAEVRIAALDRDGMITRTDKVYKKWAAWFLEQMRPFDEADLTRFTDKELEQEFRRMEQAYLKHYRLIRYGMVTHSIGMNLMLKRWLSDWLGDVSGGLYAKLISGLPENKTIRTNAAVSSLAKAAQQDPLVFERLQGSTSKEFLEAVRTDHRIIGFREALDGFLRDYGHRSHTREILYPRWSDDPTLVIDMVKALASSQVPDMDELERRKAQERVVAEKEALEAVGRLRFGLVRRPVFKLVMRYAQKYLLFRENQRFFLDHQIARQRRLFMEFGRRLADRGALADQTDVFFLSKEEVFSQAAAPSPGVRKLVEKRRKEFDRWKDVLPPKFLQGRTEFDDTVVREGMGMRITGTSSSPGIASGKARVVASIERLSEVQQGEVLVASNTDPGWTPVFSKLAGLVTETGGILSHGAVVSREYGIPAVTAVAGATKTIRTGQKITVDGNEGVVHIEEG